MDFEPAVLAEACAARFLGRMPARGIVPTDGATVLILSYDTRDLTRRCLETFLPTLAFDRHVRRVRVVDNGSRDGSPRMLAGFGGVPKVELLFREENRGIYPEWNAAARETTGDLVILGSDTEALSWNWLRAMRYLVRTNERAGIVACRQVRPEGPEGRLRVNFGGINETGSGPIHRMGWDDEGAWDRPTRHSWVTHSAVLVRRAVFDAIGGYDEAFKVYSGDSMFGRTATASGFECWYTPHGRVLHWEGRTVSACRGRGELSVADYEADWAREREFRARKTG
jgi:GT2 family glycosyltransferase